MPSEQKRPVPKRDLDRFLQVEAVQAFIADREVVVAVDEPGASPSTDEGGRPARTILSYRRLQNVVDYRGAVQGLFDQVDVESYLIIVVPHAFLYDRQLALPSRLDVRQRRLYSPGSLLAEVEEALVPNSYRIRWLGDLDDGYDYKATPGAAPAGASDIAIVLERIVPPSWSLTEMPATIAWRAAEKRRIDFEPARTRVEQDRRPTASRILLMKLDHLGDFIMGLPALQRMRRYFADAEIHLVVGSWNEAMARGLDLADRIIIFDAFPRNSSEEEANVDAMIGSFRSAVAGRYDLAVDLRSDVDTRVLLRAVDAAQKAGIGTKAQFPFLDIALPLDWTRNGTERARDDRIQQGRFAHQGSARRTHFGLHSNKETVERDCAIIWGPYFLLEPGDYIFDFYIDLEEKIGDGLLLLDVALDNGRRVAEMFVSGPGNFHLAFRVDEAEAMFEARIFTVEGHPSISFSFYGGRLLKRGPGDVLHQSEYSTLLAELIRIRFNEAGALQDLAHR